MKTQIQKVLGQCRDCQLKKLVRVKTRQPMVLTDTPGTSLEKISLDIMGPLPRSERGNAYILVIQDLLSKFIILTPLATATALDVADAFTKHFISIFGPPKAILTDRGSNFLNPLIKSLLRKYKISHVTTTAYHPQSNGANERSHQSIIEYLKLLMQGRAEWDEILPQAMMSYNTSVHETTQHTPYELIFGKFARNPSVDPDVMGLIDETYQGYLTNLFDRINTAQASAKANTEAAKQRSKRYYDQRINPQKFNIGDMVFLLKEPQKGKFADQYTGPYKILEVLSNANVRIEIAPNRDKVVHMNKLRISRVR